MRKKKLILLILLFSIIGFITSLYLAFDHYRIENGVLCNISELSCDITKNSKYAEIFNIPTGIYGMVWFLVVAFLALIERKHEIANLILIWSMLGLLFVGYFVHGEYVLKALCPYCTIAHICTILIFAATFDLYKQKGRVQNGC